MTIRRRKSVCFLLILAIGLSPSFAFASDTMQHGDYMTAAVSSDLAACDPLDQGADPACEEDGCLSPLHACGAKTGAGFIAFEITGEYRLPPRFVRHKTDSNRYRSRRAESIYRPPIA